MFGDDDDMGDDDLHNLFSLPDAVRDMLKRALDSALTKITRNREAHALLRRVLGDIIATPDDAKCRQLRSVELQPLLSLLDGRTALLAAGFEEAGDALSAGELNMWLPKDAPIEKVKSVLDELDRVSQVAGDSAAPELEIQSFSGAVMVDSLPQHDGRQGNEAASGLLATITGCSITEASQLLAVRACSLTLHY